MSQSMIDCICEWCGESFQKVLAEFKRSERIGRKHFCSLSCGAKDQNSKIKAKEVVKICPECKKKFVSTTKKKAATFCSRSCASKGSMNEDRRLAQREAGLRFVDNLISTDEVLKRREAWKYELLKKALDGRDHEFEYALENSVFDLALFDKKILVEFDGPYHKLDSQIERDLEKDAIAARNGFLVIRRTVAQAQVILPETIEGL